MPIPFRFIDASAKFLNTVDTWDGQNHGGSMPRDAPGHKQLLENYDATVDMWTSHILSSYIQGQNMEDAGDYAKLVASLPWIF